MVEVSETPPIDLGKRIGYLIKYPHGCIEQTTSSLFPQLYLPKFIELDKNKMDTIEKNIKAGIERLRKFQTVEGGFSYWPGGESANEWGTAYAGHFLVEARKAGYHIPEDMLGKWRKYQKSLAENWESGSSKGALTQAYRLYTLALYGKAEIGAMNRLREVKKLSSAAVWQLALAYKLAGIESAADQIVASDKFVVKKYSEMGNTYGTELRDKSIIVIALTAMGRREQAMRFVREISKSLSSKKWLSTQTTAYALMALAHFSGGMTSKGKFEFKMSTGNDELIRQSSGSGIFQRIIESFPLEGTSINIENSGEKPLFVSVLSRGVPAAGRERVSSKGLSMKVHYDTSELAKMSQGQNFKGTISITNRSGLDYENLVLSQIFPSGWEIDNPRKSFESALDAGADFQDVRDDRIYTYFSLKAGNTATFKVILNAAYIGRYYMPGVNVEAMYDAEVHASTKGKWIEIVRHR